MLRSTP